MKRHILLFVAAIVFMAAGSAHATITGVAIGPVAPPATLGPYTMTPFPLDPQGTPATSVVSPLGGTVDFDSSLTHVTVGAGWGLFATEKL